MLPQHEPAIPMCSLDEAVLGPGVVSELVLGLHIRLVQTLLWLPVGVVACLFTMSRSCPLQKTLKSFPPTAAAGRPMRPRCIGLAERSEPAPCRWPGPVRAGRGRP